MAPLTHNFICAVFEVVQVCWPIAPGNGHDGIRSVQRLQLKESVCGAEHGGKAGPDVLGWMQQNSTI